MSETKLLAHEILKIIGVFILAVVGIAAIAPAFLPTTYSVERTTLIEEPVEKVYAQLSSFKDRGQWDPWLASEPTAEVTIEGPAQGPGAKWSWKGKKIGEGSMEIKEVKINQMIKSELIFVSMGSSEITWTLIPVENGTEVSWAMTGESEDYFSRIMNSMMDRFVGGDFEKGLASLKDHVESLPEEAAPVAEETENVPAEEILPTEEKASDNSNEDQSI